MHLKTFRGRLSPALTGAVLLLSCGARTAVELSDAGLEAPALCTLDADCASGDACSPVECREGRCVALPERSCNDGDACTADRCDPATGGCLFTPVTLDLDGDGHRSPKPGYAPGVPGACGDDCDDRSAAARPGGTEVCDGLDNDCNGKVDDGAIYNGSTGPVRVSSAAFDRASSGGLAFDGMNYGATFSGHQRLFNAYFEGLSRAGSPVVAETALNDINSETYAGQLLYTGRTFQSAWSDPRQGGNYEVYFNRYDTKGKKLGPDLRLSQAPNFSLGPALIWNGTETIVVWDDRRFERVGSNDVRLFAQRIALDGSRIGENIQLTGEGTQAENASVANGRQRVGIAFTSQVTPLIARAKFFTTAADLSGASPIIDLGGSDVEDTSVAYVGGRFVTAWQRHGSNYGSSIYAALADESGQLISPERPITSGATFARTFSLLSLGDRLVLVWVDDHDGNYELYQQILDADLNVLSPRTRLTFTASDTLSPATALGPQGDLGVLYDDWVSGERQTYFLSLSCTFGITLQK